MQETISGVLVADGQTDEKAQRDFAGILDSIRRGEMKGVVLQESGGSNPSGHRAPSVARGAMYGALVGFVLGIIPMLASVFTAAGAGMLIVKASQVRIEGGSAPRLRFGKKEG
jgi:hypothetical protein